MKKKGLQDKTINELRAEARKKGIPLLRSMKKQDILRVLKKGEKPRKASPGNASSTTKQAAGIKTKKPGTTKRTAGDTARTRKSETATPIQSRVRTSSAAVRKTAVKKKTLNKAQQPAREKPAVNHPVVKTAIKANSRPLLPGEYGENDLFLIAVDPDVVYASWEIRREDLPGQRRGVKMRLFDITGTGPGCRPERFIDIDIAKRVGNGLFEIRMHGRDVVAEIGHIRDGRFMPILRSNMVSFPVPMHDYESGAKEPPEPGTPVGY